MDGAPHRTEASPADTLTNDIRTVVAAIVQRDAKARAAFKDRQAARHATAAEGSARQQHLAHLRRTFERWCHDVLEVRVRTADIQLRQARYTLKQEFQSPLRPEFDCAPDAVVAETVLVLARDNDRRKLTISLHADGAVRAREGGPDDTGHAAGGARLEGKAEALGAQYADEVVSGFVRGAIAGGRDSRLR